MAIPSKKTNLQKRARKKMKESLKRVTRRNLIQKKAETSDRFQLHEASVVLVNKGIGPNLLPLQEKSRPNKLNN